MALKSNGTPSVWVEGYTKEEVDPGHKDFKWIQSKVAKGSTAALNIQKVYRIKNSTIWNAYKETRARIFQEMGGMTFVPEKRLFHGSPWAMNIAQQGFSLQFANAGCAYGKGVYFSELSSESARYSSKNGQQQVYYMLMCRVALGKMTQESVIQNGYHSLHQNTKYVVYDDKQAYPSFLIEFLM